MKNNITFLFVVLCFFTATNPLYAQWIQTSGPYGGEVNSFAVLGTNLFAGISRGGVFLSTNNGSLWTEVNSGLTATDVQSLAVSGTNLFAGTLGGGVFLSTNNGATWAAVNSGLTGTDVYSLAVSGANLFAGTSIGVFRSTNNGTQWTVANTGLTHVNVFAVSGANLFASDGSSNVFRSTDNGTSWIAVTSSWFGNSVASLVANSTNLFVGPRGSALFAPRTTVRVGRPSIQLREAQMFPVSLSVARISLRGMAMAAFFFPRTTGQPGLRRVPG